MDSRSTWRSPLGLVVFAVSLTLFSPITLAQDQSVGARSATRQDEAAIEQAAIEQAVAVEESQPSFFGAATGGTDVTLSDEWGQRTRGGGQPVGSSNNVIVTKLFGLRISTNGGATFGAEINAVVPGYPRSLRRWVGRLR